MVPWRYGFGHTWALRWLLSQSGIAPQILRAIPGWELGDEPRVTKGPDREVAFGGVRADLAFTVRATDGHTEDVAVETKVEDMFRPAQVAAYRGNEHVPLMYLPGLTGFLIAGNRRESDELHLTGHTLGNALAEIELPWMIHSYVRDVRVEARRYEQIFTEICETGDAVRSEGHTDFKALRDVAWLVGVREAIEEMAPRRGIGPDASLRAEANDRGIFWHGCRQPLPHVAGDAGVGLYIDVLAPVRSDDWIVAVKAGWGPGLLGPVFDYARASGPPGDDPLWRRAARRLGGDSATVYSARVTGISPRAAAETALRAAEWIKAVAAAA